MSLNGRTESSKLSSARAYHHKRTHLLNIHTNWSRRSNIKVSMAQTLLRRKPYPSIQSFAIYWCFGQPQVVWTLVIQWRWKLPPANAISFLNMVLHTWLIVWDAFSTVLSFSGIVHIIIKYIIFLNGNKLLSYWL